VLFYNSEKKSLKMCPEEDVGEGVKVMMDAEL